jgi:hypothetical protein
VSKKRGRVTVVVSGVQLVGNTAGVTIYASLADHSPGCCDVAQVWERHGTTDVPEGSPLAGCTFAYDVTHQKYPHPQS